MRSAYMFENLEEKFEISKKSYQRNKDCNLVLTNLFFARFVFI
jgi:hypothetical protein